MTVDGYVFMTDQISKFFNTLRITGWFHHATDALASIRLIDPHLTAGIAEVGIAHAGVASLGLNKGFVLQVLRDTDSYDPAIELELATRAGWVHRVSLGDLARDRMQHYPTPAIFSAFRDSIQAIPGARVLDVGGRARSGLLRKTLMPGADYVVFDVQADRTVDVVGDAHELARFFPEAQFDGVLSVSVFEHLLMPWTVVTQINKVLKMGGLAMISTHQTLGMHDLPWDFWRVSDTAWDALFNVYTGFEIVSRAVDSEQFVIPFVMTPDKAHAERAAGYEGSAVLARKIGPCRMNWPLTAGDIIATQYPEN